MKVAVLLSGGVDSSVGLRLLKAQGRYDLTAFYLKIWLEDELAFLGDCPWEEDLAYCRSVCEQLDVPLEVLPLQAEYFEKVVENTVQELRLGRTPSPDILCNQRIKFGEFLDRTRGPFDRVASGHYARVEEDLGIFYLKRAPDPVKDQTYFLSYLTQEQLGRALFPIGHLTKREVRALARRFDLPTQNRKDSQGICFLGKISYRDFVKFHLGQEPGDILELGTERKLGEHQGFWFYTIGQRQGLGLPDGPWYVAEKDPERNIVYVSHRSELKALRRHRFVVDRTNWISGPPQKPALQVKIRHVSEPTHCVVESLPEGRLAVAMTTPDPGIAPGQYAVFYDEDVCLGGGIIDTSLPNGSA